VNVVNAMLREQEVVYILKDCESRAVIVDEARLPIIEAVKPELNSLEMVVVHNGAENSPHATLDSVLDQGSEEFKPVGTKGSDICHLMYTSGTTGWPKGVAQRGNGHPPQHFSQCHGIRQGAFQVR